MQNGVQNMVAQTQANMQNGVNNVLQAMNVQKKGMIKFTHNVANGPAVDIYSNGVKILSNVPYKATSSYISFKTGVSNIQVTVAGTQTLLVQSNYNVNDKSCVNMIVHGDVKNLTTIAILVLNDVANCLPGYGQFRFVHAAATLPAVDVYFNYIKTFSNVKYGQTGKPEYVKINCDKVTVTVKPAGLTSVVYETKYNFDCGSNNTLIASGLLDTQNGVQNTAPFTLLKTTDNPGWCINA